MLSINNARFWYTVDQPPIIYNCSLTVGASEFVAIVGESGSGKTTLLRLASGLLHSSLRHRGAAAGVLNGDIIYRDEVLQRPHRDFGYVPQNFSAALIPSLNVRDNILLPARYGGIDEAALKRVQHLMEESGIYSVADEYVYRISGGQKQRVAICRAVMNEPRIVFMDEPFANLDPTLRPEIGDLLTELRRESHLAVVFVTHDVQGATRLADRVVGVRRSYGLPQYTEWLRPFDPAEIERWMAF